MAEKDFNGGEIPENPAIPQAPKSRKKRRLFLKIIGVLGVVLVLLVLAAPTLLGTGPVVSAILGQVNNQLNGKVEVSSLSLGWFTGVKVDGVRVTDAGGTQIAQIDHAAVPYPLWKALTGKFALGDIALDGVSFKAELDANHQLNFAQLVKPSSTTPAPANAPASANKSKSSKLPDISANLKLTNCHGTFSQSGKPTVFLTKLDGEIKIPDINQPITDQINAAVKLGDQPEGTIALSGSAAVISGNQIALNSAEIHQKLDLQNIDLQTAKPFVPDSVGVATLDGALGVHVSIDLTGGKNVAVDAAITATKPIAFGGKVLHGDTFTTNSFKADVPQLTAVFPDGLKQWQSGRIKVGADAGSSPILLKLDQGQVTVLADLMPQAILNLIAKKKPASEGQLVLTSSFDLAKIIPQLKNTIHQAPGVSIHTAGLSEKLTVAISTDKAVVSNIFDSTKVTGTQSAEGAVSKFIAIDPIHLSITAADLGGGGDLPNLRDMNLTIQSKFANGEFKGDSLSDLNGLLKADLNVLREELAQFVDLKGKSFGGNVEIKVTDHGQLTAPDYKADVQLDVTATNLQYSDATRPQVSEPMLQLDVSADLQGSAQAALQTVQNISLTLRTGDMSAPTLELRAKVPSVTLVPAPAEPNTPSSGYVLADAPAPFKITHFTADLAKLQKEFAAVPAGTAGVVVNQGAVSITSAGTLRPHAISFDSLAMNADHLFVARQLADGKQISAVAGEAINLHLVGAVDYVPTADKKAFDINARVKTFSLTDTASILDIHKDLDGELAVTRTAGGGLSGAGQLALSVQLGSINDIRKILGQTEMVVKTTAGDIRSGKLSGTVTMVAAAQNKTGVNADLNLDDVAVTTATGTLPAQSASVTLKASADQAIANITIEQVGVKSNLANATITGATISLSSASIFDKVQSAHWQVEVPDLKPVMDLANAFSPPAAAAPADKSIAPLEITSGAISLNGDLSHDHSAVNINLNDVSAKNFAFARGQIHYAAKPIDVKILASIQTGDGKTVTDQIRQLQVTQLTGNLGIATLSMPTPISISQLSSNPIATGGIQLVGNLTDLTQLLSAIQGQKPDAYPYHGDYTLTENIGTQQNTISLKGGMQIAKFQSYNGEAVTFSEDLVDVGNDLSVTTARDDESVTINSFTAAMQSSGAANFSLKNGSLANLKTTRDMLLQLNVNYDLAKLWPIVQPMMGDKYKTLKIAGQFQKQFNVSGRYPANVPSTDAIKTLHADGDVAVASFDYDGLNLQNLVLPFTLSNGQLVTVYANKPAGQNTAAPAVANGGTMDLSNLTIDLTQDPPRLTMPPKKALVHQVTINPLFAGTILKSVINNPLFAGKGATGLIDLSIDDCTNLPLGDLVMQQSSLNTGKIDMHVSMTKLNIGLGSDALQGILKQQSFEADVKDGTISIAKGICVEHINFSTGSYVLAFDGNVRLKDEALMPLTLGFPLATIAAKTHLADANTVQFLPDQLKVPVEGTVSKPNYRFDKVIPKALTDAAAKALANGLLGGGNKNNNNNNGAGNNGGNGNADPLGGLLKGLEKKNKKKQGQ